MHLIEGQLAGLAATHVDGDAPDRAGGLGFANSLTDELRELCEIMDYTICLVVAKLLKKAFDKTPKEARLIMHEAIQNPWTVNTGYAAR